MKIMIILLTALLSLSATAQETVKCSLRAPEKCSTTNQLFWASGTRDAIKTFLGSEEGHLLYRNPDGKAWQDAFEVLSGPSDERQRLANGWVLFGACRAHSCDEKGAILLDTAKRILAIGIISYRCDEPRPDTQKPCYEDAWLTIYMARTASEQTIQSTMGDWAKAELGAQPKSIGENPTTVGHFQIIRVGDKSNSRP